MNLILYIVSFNSGWHMSWVNVYFIDFDLHVTYKNNKKGSFNKIVNCFRSQSSFVQTPILFFIQNETGFSQKVIQNWKWVVNFEMHTLIFSFYWKNNLLNIIIPLMINIIGITAIKPFHWLILCMPSLFFLWFIFGNEIHVFKDERPPCHHPSL